MIPELGQISLIVACLIALWQGSGVTRSETLGSARRGAGLVFLLTATAFGLLIAAHVASDFSVANVYQNSHTAKPFLYRVTGSWGNHEGSMLLFASILGLYAALLAFLPSSPVFAALRVRALAILALLMAGLLAFILATSNPFERLYPVPLEGQEMNPLLQDVGLALHPPMLYLGYVGFGVVYALALAGLLEKELDATAFANLIRPWALVPWSLLGLGIGLGSWWAYRELGWGGWWFWDPVENASLLPWLAATALIHSIATLRRTGQLLRWVMLLAIVTFLLSLTGTFLVRSGVLTSVHSFASDPARGVFILGYLMAVGGAGLLAYARHQRHAAPAAPLPIVSRGGMILLNNLLTLVACASILVAMLYPLVLDALGLRPISIGAPYYDAVILPLALPLLLLAGAALLLPWPEGGARSAWRKGWPLLLAGLASALYAALLHAAPPMVAAGILLGVWVMLASLRSVSPWATITPARLGAAMAHGGIGLLALAATIGVHYQLSGERAVTPGETVALHGWQVRLGQPRERIGENYRARAAEVAIDTGSAAYSLFPEERSYPARGTVTQEAAIRSRPAGDIYTVIRAPSEAQQAGPREGVPLASKTVLRLYFNPLMQPLWFAMAMIAAGGLLAACRR